MRSAFLALLARAPAHGYELKQAFDGAFGGVWPPINVGQISTTLARLERDGLVRGVHVEQAHRPDKKVYELTADGQRELDEWIATPTPGPRLRDEFILRLVLAQTPGLDSASDPRVLIKRRKALIARDNIDVRSRQNTPAGAAGTPSGPVPSPTSPG
jgi:DNA-binding PadR family transcriptional regulator